MPIKDITNEEKSNLYMIGKKPKEVQRISESERGISVVYGARAGGRAGLQL